MPTFKVQTDLERLRSTIARLDQQKEDDMQQVLLWSKASPKADVTLAVWQSPMIYAFVASNRYQTILRLGHSNNAHARLKPRQTRNTLGHPDFIDAQLLDPVGEVYGFIVKNLKDETSLIPYFNPPLNVADNQIKELERHRNDRLKILNCIRNYGECDGSQLSSSTGMGYNSVKQYADQLESMGLITVEEGRSNKGGIRWIHKPTMLWLKPSVACPTKFTLRFRPRL